MKGYGIALAIVVVLSGCSTLGTEITKENNEIKMPHYLFIVPPDQEWHLLRPDDIYETAVLTKKLGPFTYQIRMMRNLIRDEKLRAASAKIVAGDFRDREKQIMIEQGVNKGMYQISYLVKGEERVGGNTFYTMDYHVVTDTATQSASLYLYFPKDEKNDAFIVAHYSETVPRNALLLESLKPEFIQILKSLRVSQ